MRHHLDGPAPGNGPRHDQRVPWLKPEFCSFSKMSSVCSDIADFVGEKPDWSESGGSKDQLQTI